MYGLLRLQTSSFKATESNNLLQQVYAFKVYSRLMIYCVGCFMLESSDNVY